MPVSTETITCRECGCDDWHACTMPDEMPCWWHEVDYESGDGLCSACLVAAIEKQLPRETLA